MGKDFLNNEEKEIIESFDSIDFSKVQPPTNAEQRVMKSAARGFLKNETKMNIRIDPDELERIKQFAETEGLKYQSFVKSVLHKYITGQLVEKRKIS